MRRRKTKIYSDSSEDGPPPKKPSKIAKPIDDSSSESDIENYLQPIDQIDLSSSFFNIQKDIPWPADQLEDDVFKPDDDSAPIETPSVSGSHFQQLHDYTKKMEEARKSIEEYKTRKQTENEQTDVSNLLAAEKAKLKEALYDGLDITLHSSDFESCSDSENDGWEEVAEGRTVVPRESLEITVEMPGAIKKKKREDLTAVIKRRINRIKKLNQLLIHKVHLLCWIAHGNYVSAAISSQEVLAVALSLVPPEPARPTDLNYLKRLVKWYRNVVKSGEQTMPKTKTLEELLQEQLAKRKAYNKVMFVYMFVAVLRSLGVPCRLVLSLQVEPVRPPKTELLSLSTKKNSVLKSRTSTFNTSKHKTDKNKGKTQNKKMESSKDVSDNHRNESAEVKVEEIRKTRSKSAAETNTTIFSKSTFNTSKHKTDGNKGKTQNKKIESSKATKTTCSKDVTNIHRNESAEVKVGEIRKTRSKSVTETNNTGFSKEKLEAAKKIRLEKATVGDQEIRKTRSKTAAEAKNTRLRNATEGEAKEIKSTRSKSVVRNAMEGEAKKIKRTRSKSAVEGKNKVHFLIENPESTEKTSLSTREAKAKEIKKTRSQSVSEARNRKLPREKSEASKKVRPKYTTEVKHEDFLEGMRTRSKSVKTDTKERGANRVDEIKSKISPNPEIKQQKPRTSSTLITAYFKNTKAKNMGKSKSSTSVNTKPRRSPRNQTSTKIPQLDGANDDSSDDADVITTTTSRPKLRTLPRRLIKKMEKYNLSDSETDDSTAKTPFSPKNTGFPQISQRKVKNVLQNKTSKEPVDNTMVRKRRSNEDIDYIPTTKKKHSQSDDGALLEIKQPAENRVEDSTPGVDLWAEVFSAPEKRWISVNVIEGQVDCANELQAKATPPISYVLAWNNNNTVKDVTSRYCKHFNTTTRILRIDPKWWTATLKPFVGPTTIRDKEENEELERQQFETPLPKNIKEYKNHPLYVLKRHLLKYEAIYPPDAPTLGFVRKEPVYSRQCVHILHPRDIWFKKAKVVKPGEKPYKIVKGRPRWDRLAHKIVTDPEMDIFGPWQVEDYDPPTAENGVVPRNAYGNVELFKPCMLPKKTVHLRLPGLNKIARRMNIDCASAFTGFDYSKGWVHPAYDGYVVCEEYADILEAAWALEQDELEEKEQEKIDKRVYGNWKRLIRGLLIRERLKVKYEFGDVTQAGSDKKAKKGPRFVTKKRK